MGARVKTEVSLEENVIGVEMLVPVVVEAEALKINVAPRTRDVELPGERLTLPGKMGGPDLAPPPQPAALHREKIATADHKTFERNLPMHPLVASSIKPVGERLVEMENC